MENSQTKTTKGFSIMIVFGSYGGFHFTFDKWFAIHFCLGWLGVTLILTDMENALWKMHRQIKTLKETIKNN